VTWAPDYTDLDTFRAYIHLEVDPDPADDDDAAVYTPAITAASRAIDRACGRQFGTTDDGDDNDPVWRYYTAQWVGSRYVVNIDDLFVRTDMEVESGGEALTTEQLDVLAPLPLTARHRQRDPHTGRPPGQAPRRAVRRGRFPGDGQRASAAGQAGPRRRTAGPRVPALLVSTMAEIMDALAGAPTIATAYGYPEESPGKTPCWIVGYPDDIQISMVMGNAAHRAVFPCWYVAGPKNAKATRDAFSAILADDDFVTDIEAASAGMSRAVTDVRIQQIVLTGVTYMAARYDVDVIFDFVEAP
jgi:hypothetical protein